MKQIDIIKKYVNIFIKNLDKRHFRLHVILCCVVFLFVILHIKLFTIFHFNKTKKIIKDLDDNSSINRLDIIDRNGILLARNVVAYDFYVYPYKLIDIEENLDKIVDIFPNLDNRRDRLLETMKTKAMDGKGAVLVKQNIFATDKQKILNSGILGVEFQETQRRIYPHNNVASHILGFLSVDGDGMMGIERYFDSYLKNTQNKSIQLSIDINIQNVVRHIVVDAVKKSNAKSGIALIVNIKTGELISAVSVPDFNPNNLKDASSDNLFNRFSLGVYELGSVFKIFTATLALDSGISSAKVYDTHTPFVLGDFIIHNFAGDLVRPNMDMVGIMQHSSNIGIARIIEEIGNFNKQKELFQRLGLLDKIDIELPEIGRPMYQNRWSKTQAITRGYGHGIAVSPMNFIYAFSSIINHGQLVKPTIIKVDNNMEGLPVNIVSEKTSKKVRDLLRNVVKEGTGRQSASEKYDVGGKTGTAIKTASKKDKRIKGLSYSRFKNLVSFVAAVPMKDPEYAYYILLDEPHADSANVLRVSGGRLVAPAMSELITITGPMLNIAIEDSN